MINAGPLRVWGFKAELWGGSLVTGDVDAAPWLAEGSQAAALEDLRRAPAGDKWLAAATAAAELQWSVSHAKISFMDNIKHVLCDMNFRWFCFILFWQHLKLCDSSGSLQGPVSFLFTDVFWGSECRAAGSLRKARLPEQFWNWVNPLWYHVERWDLS